MALLVGTTLAGVALSFTLSWRSGEAAVAELGRRLQDSAEARIADHIRQHLAQAERAVEQASTTVLDIEHPDDLQRQFWYQISGSGGLSAVFMATAEREFVGVERRPDGIRYLTRSGAITDYAFTTYLADRDGRAQAVAMRQPDYDPRARPWYRQVSKAGRTAWSGVYVFSLHRTLYLSLGKPLPDRHGRRGTVVAAAFNLQQITEFLRLLNPVEGAVTFIVEPDGQLIATSSDAEVVIERPSGPSRASPADLNDSVLRSALLQGESVRTQLAAGERIHRQFDWRGRRYQLLLSPFTDRWGLRWVVGVTLPEQALYGPIHSERERTLWFSAGAVLLSMLVGVAVAAWLGRRVDRLVQSAARMADGELDRRVQIGNPVELAQLGDNFNIMAERLSRSMAELRELNTDLERTVAERTQALENEVLERRLAEQEARRERDFSHYLIDALPGIFLLVGEDGRLLFWNAQLERVTGLDNAMLRRLPAVECFALGAREVLAGEFLRAFVAGHASVEADLAGPNGGLPCQISIQRLPVERGMRLIAVGIDVSERRALELELERQAQCDALTGLHNRGHFLQLAERELLRARRYGQGMALLMIDVDWFKSINDRFGHHIGDRALRTLADLCRQTLREVDAVGRLGGEEFAALLPNADINAAQAAAERLRASVEAGLLVLDDGHEIGFTISIGVAQLSEIDSLDSLLERADRGLYQAKRSGRNRVCCV
ncbi:sensor domain-containing diguanylate cyclase [Chitinimonas lacunae]|uniref:diguanylate cyclase n=1 Tax=Chitinimonas lacunae TaxID=1963018 RepID=A0ABV8MSR0_9NEIS